MRNIRIKQTKGFSILAVILVIVAVIVAIGVWALSGESNTSSSSSSSAKIASSAILNNASSLKLAFDTAVISGATAATITFQPNIPSSTNMLDPNNGINLPKENANIFKADYIEPNGVWTFSKTFYTLLGSPGQPETVVLLAGIKDTVCKELNKNVNGSDFIPTYPPFNTSEQFVTGSTASNPNTSVQVDFSSGGTDTNALQWEMGCIKGANGNDNNVFFRVLKIN
jgi:hypothetical protein